MVESITKGYKPRRKTETQVENNSRQIVVLSGQKRVIKFGEFAGVPALIYILASKEGEKGRGAFKCKREGYALFKASHVQDVKYNFSSHYEFCFFET